MQIEQSRGHGRERRHTAVHLPQRIQRRPPRRRQPIRPTLGIGSGHRCDPRGICVGPAAPPLDIWAGRFACPDRRAAAAAGRRRASEDVSVEQWSTWPPGCDLEHGIRTWA
eukprot:scaffold18234_cov79-Isochrysis_galbana.AAC.1